MSALELRDYQQEAIARVRRGLMQGHKRQLLTMPTGSGKTEVACGLIEAVAEKLGVYPMAVSFWLEEVAEYKAAVKWDVDIDALDWSPYDKLRLAA